MKFNFVAGVLVTALALTAVPLTVIAQEEDPGMEEPGTADDAPTVFACETNAEGNPTTVAKKGGDTTPPLIVWETTYFGQNYTPENRCGIVSEKLTAAVADNGGSLAGLQLTHGLVNRQTVICWVKGQGRCNAQNMLFTLRPANAKKAPAIVQQLQNFALGQADVPPVAERTPQRYANLQTMLSRHLRLGSNPSRTSNPGQSRPTRRRI
ncbi:COP23 domain-containing protein [Argonema antarcticum]|uniref:COP23 domain-containing protein n=1 Tax=Argonema antarcticum TaxID=2942763 RepID=UPI0020119C43|nr:COP23 domain-containing protein [Argonema antarcticum]MCL1472208.1 COP23 domain-containing protein [Argonema antarcticum A004/B2]